MNQYDFLSLSYYEFEQLCLDLLSRHLRLDLRCFKPGKDAGIDLRCHVGGRDAVVVQCKHYSASGLSTLLRHLREAEVPKVAKLNPQRYIVATSVRLTPANATEIWEIFSPFCRTPDDVFGGDDLNALLRTYPEVEKAHFKLWLTSAAVLSRVLNSRIFVQSSLTKSEALRKLRLYVPTPAYARCSEILRQHRTCIISGMPGIGKTTLAEVLLCKAHAAGWEPIVVSQNISEALAVFRDDSGSKQVIYYDDFLGQVEAGDNLAKNEDAGIAQLMTAVAKSSSKYFILTTREHILRQAQSTHEVLYRANLDMRKCVVSLDDYSEETKARILYNHLFFGDVSDEFIASLVESGLYRSIVHHRNYSPRIVDFMTDMSRGAACSPAAYPDHFLKSLDHPNEIWHHAYTTQLTRAAKDCLVALVCTGSFVRVDDLQAVFSSLHGFRARAYNFECVDGAFIRALKQLEGTFVRIERGADGAIASVQNPSIVDFLLDQFRREVSLVPDIASSAVCFEQVERLLSLVVSPGWGEDGLGQYAIAGSAIGTAALRTLDAESTGVDRWFTGSGKPHWQRRPRCLETRLATVVRIATQVESAELRTVVHRRIESVLADMSAGLRPLQAVCPLLVACRGAHWLGQTFEGDSGALAIRAYLGHTSALADAIAFAQWFTTATSCISAPYMDEVREKARLIAQSAAEELPPDDDWAIDEARSGVLALERHLGIVLDEVLDTIGVPGTEPGERGGEDLFKEDPTTGSLRKMSEDRLDDMFEGLVASRASSRAAD